MHQAASFSATLGVTVPAQIPRSATAAGYLDGNGVAFSSPLSCYYSSSLPSSYSNNIQRSISSHSLPIRIQLTDHLASGGGSGNGFFSPSPNQLPLPPLSSFEFTSSSWPVRRVFSTGDLQVPSRGPHGWRRIQGCMMRIRD
jgi:hypothetical protein